MILFTPINPSTHQLRQLERKKTKIVAFKIVRKTDIKLHSKKQAFWNSCIHFNLIRYAAKDGNVTVFSGFVFTFFSVRLLRFGGEMVCGHLTKCTWKEELWRKKNTIVSVRTQRKNIAIFTPLNGKWKSKNAALEQNHFYLIKCNNGCFSFDSRTQNATRINCYLKTYTLN